MKALGWWGFAVLGGEIIGIASLVMAQYDVPKLPPWAVQVLVLSLCLGGPFFAYHTLRASAVASIRRTRLREQQRETALVAARRELRTVQLALTTERGERARAKPDEIDKAISTLRSTRLDLPEVKWGPHKALNMNVVDIVRIIGPALRQPQTLEQLKDPFCRSRLGNDYGASWVIAFRLIGTLSEHGLIRHTKVPGISDQQMPQDAASWNERGLDFLERVCSLAPPTPEPLTSE